MATALKNIPFNNYVPTVDLSGAMYEMKLRRNTPCSCGTCEKPGYIQFVDTTCYCGYGCSGSDYGTITIQDNECYKYMVEHAYSLVDPEGCLGMGLPVRITTNPKIQGTQYADHTIAFVDIGYCSYGLYKPFAVSEAVTLRNLPCGGGCGGGSSYCWTLGYDIYSCGDFIDFKASRSGQCSQSDYCSYPVKAARYLEHYCSYGNDQLTFELGCYSSQEMIDFKVGYCGSYYSYPVRSAGFLKSTVNDTDPYSLRFEYCNNYGYCIIDFKVGYSYESSNYYSCPVKVATQLAEYNSCYCFYDGHSIGFNYCTYPFDMITFKSVCGELPVRYAYLLKDECGRYSTKISYSDLTSNPGDYCIVAFSNCY